MTIINELTDEGAEARPALASAASPSVAPAESGVIGSEGGAGDATSADDGAASNTSDAASAPAKAGAKKGE